LLLASDGNFYGTTSRGGAFDQGTLFRMTASGAVTVLHDFTGREDGGWPLKLIQADDGNLYVSSRQGGVGCGVILRATLQGSVTPLHTFPVAPGSQQYPDGCSPSPLVQAFDGKLYGTAGNAVNVHGLLFRMSRDGNFEHVIDAPYSTAIMQASDGLLYGTAANVVYSISLDEPPTLSTVTSLQGLGSYPGGLIQVSNRFFVGTLFHGVYRMTTGGRATLLHQFTGMNGDGSYPNDDLVLASDGTVYGTTSRGGDGSNPELGIDASGHGTVFKIAPDGTVSTLYMFTGGTDGAYPSAGLAIGADGQLYGTTNDEINHGTIFRLTLDGQLTTLARAFTDGLSGATRWRI
jgi:uncharacterized repeat protein (TIGR03803 family)